MARTGYTLPVFAVAAAKAALVHLQNSDHSLPSVELDLLPGNADIPVHQVATLETTSALAVTLSDPGDNLDLTRNTPVWAWVKISHRQDQALILEAGVGVGKTIMGEAAIYDYARRLFDANLLPLIPADQTVTVQIILPDGRELAKRTSNEAFGILNGLSLLGTSGISQPMSAADHLEEFRADLQQKASKHPNLVFCLGSNGQQVAQRLSIPEEVIVTTGNWLGALLVEAGLYNAQSVLLIGYQGKLIKLAGGIFNTSSHLADAKLEIIASAVIETGGDIQAAQAVLQAPTADAAHKTLIELRLADTVFRALAEKISHKAEIYVKKYANVSVQVGVILFDRKGLLISQDGKATELLEKIQMLR
ncbi:cobalt-precorrin-5B (C(1))-methyltransferase CbiD [Aetokthonos hydrillicola Thurmond2011]|jgi:cobalt-precorrin-5B (C1)-methyltransferase|uniref:Cobalt-precorrin-5B C(1)-methyltransferase n=1 Tax=Aetokthonos hydrillicola Thurmond2011 TaxID=2712845 RepID=A0AAP5M562_9CYAN|nr:cobalt-precorrin-5B (C(1))-methyltransferase CbiD [Aetokthonos hydrillicola]MBO3463357.1 cobalt-precorrin-5B (C(1))-methyltransferase [Aetokthonos hydrillicola CCALA 1050]MBW4583755.1 cobalt-precorrin-5B (C(1))-methyltransferase [Aetokthonos hydrillicola CCALA 1050]MDR9895551.1 cobalt-precorrin-5B (C(1))-methyltransferase CbiD [Aetokthonos hydrillicola Thurmond2011]